MTFAPSTSPTDEFFWVCWRESRIDPGQICRHDRCQWNHIAPMEGAETRAASFDPVSERFYIGPVEPGRYLIARIDLKYEWVCVGCELLIGGSDENRVQRGVETHKQECDRFQEWNLTAVGVRPEEENP